MTRYLVAVILVVASLAACTSSSSTSPEQSAVAEPTLIPRESSGSPLEETLGFPSDPERRQYQLISMQRQADTTMVQCMQSAGFFYEVRSAEEVLRSGAFVGDGSQEWTQQNGLGVTSSFIAALATDAARATTDAATAASTNLDYVASLTPEQAVEYDRALVGDIASDASDEYEPGGCFAESYTEILQLLAFIDEFEAGLAMLNSRLNADPRLVGFQAEWASCMQAAGYDYANENALVDDVYARLLDIELVDRQGVTLVESAEALDALDAYERGAAVAAFDCRLAFADEVDRLRYDYEREFLDDNRFRIAELLTPAP